MNILNHEAFDMLSRSMKTNLGEKKTLANFKKQKISYHNSCNTNISNERSNNTFTNR